MENTEGFLCAAQLTDGGLTQEFVVFEVFSAMLAAHKAEGKGGYCLLAVRDT
jgi:hypothetical protein